MLLDLSTLSRNDGGGDAANIGDASDAATDTSNPSDAFMDVASKTWIDDFNRPDSVPIGNGWIMKQPAAFRLVNSRAENRNVNTSYRDNVVYRPATEDVLDVTVSLEFRVTQPPGYPQVMARIQQSTVSTPNGLDCYLFFIANAPNSAMIARQRGTAYLTTLATIPLSPPVDTSHDYRLRMTVTGTGSVNITGEVEVYDTDKKMWMMIGNQPITDTSVERIDTAGSVGFSTSNGEQLYSYDNFTRTPL